jgi:hypothetical protein
MIDWDIFPDRESRPEARIIVRDAEGKAWYLSQRCYRAPGAVGITEGGVIWKGRRNYRSPRSPAATYHILTLHELNRCST